MERWDACLGDAMVPPGGSVVAGLDLATTTDLTALVMLSAACFAVGVWLFKRLRMQAT
jgi:hypothetical protein